MPAPQSKRFCFTLNNYTEDELAFIQRIADVLREHGGCDVGGAGEGDTVVPSFSVSGDARSSGLVRCSYIIAGREHGDPGAGTPHLQGYVELGRKVTLRGLKCAFGLSRVHLEVARGEPTECADYCRKEDREPIEGGTRLRGRGSSRSLDACKALIDGGGSLLDVAESDFASFCRHSRALSLYASLRVAPRTSPTEVIWYHGPTGTGKSRRAHDESIAAYGAGHVCWIADVTLKWFDPYRGEPGAVIDDFAGDAPIVLLLRLFDRYPFQVPIKGAFVELAAKKIWVTSNFRPHILYGSQPQWAALERRLTRVEEIEDYSPSV